MATRSQMAVSKYIRDVIKGVKLEKDHRNYDSALREIVNRSDVDPEHYIEITRKAEAEEEKEKDDSDEKEETDEDNQTDDKTDEDKSLESMGFDFDW